jgi:hypothetical protein
MALLGGAFGGHTPVFCKGAQRELNPKTPPDCVRLFRRRHHAFPGNSGRHPRKTPWSADRLPLCPTPAGVYTRSGGGRIQSTPRALQNSAHGRGSSRDPRTRGSVKTGSHVLQPKHKISDRPGRTAARSSRATTRFVDFHASLSSATAHPANANPASFTTRQAAFECRPPFVPPPVHSEIQAPLQTRPSPITSPISSPISSPVAR